MSDNFTFLWVAMALTAMAIVIHYWRSLTSKKEPTVPNEEDNIP